MARRSCARRNDDDGWDVIALIAGLLVRVPRLRHGRRMVSAPTCSTRPAPTAASAASSGWRPTRAARSSPPSGWRPLDPARVELERLYVNPRWRRRGLADTLADLVEQTAERSRGARKIELWSDSRFENAHRFYEARGYVRAGPDRELGDLSRTREHHYVKALC